MTSTSWENDPQPELPDCFRNQAYVEKLVRGLKSLKKQGREEDSSLRRYATRAQIVVVRRSRRGNQKQRFAPASVRSRSSDEFGPMMAAAADARGFFQARKQAFLGDGQAYNWTIQQRWFPTFVAIADFVHIIEYVYDAAKATPRRDRSQCWQQYVIWATACWQGRVAEVTERARRGGPSQQEPFAAADVAGDRPAAKSSPGPSRTCRTTAHRMDYPRYRREGLPVTSSLAESLGQTGQ